MPLQPPPTLVELLERLGVATFSQILHAGRKLRSLSAEMLPFESVWIDALVRSKILTPFQAQEINTGRGDSLQLGPYLLCEKLAGSPYLKSYRAKHRESGAVVRLSTQCRTGSQSVDSVSIESFSNFIKTRQVANLSYVDAGCDNDWLYFASPWIEGRTASQWIITNGRFSDETVLEIAQSMAAQLVILENGGQCHGDIAPWNLLLTTSGESLLIEPGLRTWLRPEEGFAMADLPPEAYDYLAPERIVDGTPPTISSDIYACGCLWWHMLCGRPPLAGGDSLAKLRAAEAAAIPDVRRYSPQTPNFLAETLAACLQKDPSCRPKSSVRLAEMLGGISQEGNRQVAQLVGSTYRTQRNRRGFPHEMAPGRNWSVWLAAIVGGLSLVLLLLGPVFRRAGSQPVTVYKQENRSQVTKTKPVRKSAHVGQISNPSRQVENLPHVGQISNLSRPIENLPYEKNDRQVQPAGYYAEVHPAAVSDWLLKTDSPQTLETLSLQRGQRVIGQSGRRASILVPTGGLKIDGEDIRFENVDFCWDLKNINSSSSPVRTDSLPSSKKAAMLLFSGSHVAFRGCRFFATGAESTLPVVLRWANDENVNPASLALSSGRVHFSNCIFQRVGPAIDCRRRGAIALDLKNCLLFEIQSLLRIDHTPELEEPIILNLTQLTMRDTGPLVVCRHLPSDNPPGEIAIHAESCVFSLRKQEPLLAFEGTDPPEALLRNIRWNGSGSLLDAETSFAAWKTTGGFWEPLDDTALAIAGLVRSRIDFMKNSENNEDPVSSGRLLHWQAPLPTLDPPGIDAESLPKK